MERAEFRRDTIINTFVGWAGQIHNKLELIGLMILWDKAQGAYMHVGKVGAINRTKQTPRSQLSCQFFLNNARVSLARWMVSGP